MIDVKQAAQSAISYCSNLFPNAEEFRLEEVEIAANELYWLITVGFNEDDNLPGHNLFKWVNPEQSRHLVRKYKVVQVDAETGVVRSVKMRNPLELVS